MILLIADPWIWGEWRSPAFEFESPGDDRLLSACAADPAIIEPRPIFIDGNNAVFLCRKFRPPNLTGEIVGRAADEELAVVEEIIGCMLGVLFYDLSELGLLEASPEECLSICSLKSIDSPIFYSSFPSFIMILLNPNFSDLIFDAFAVEMII